MPKSRFLLHHGDKQVVLLNILVGISGARPVCRVGDCGAGGERESTRCSLIISIYRAPVKITQGPMIFPSTRAVIGDYFLSISAGITWALRIPFYLFVCGFFFAATRGVIIQDKGKGILNSNSKEECVRSWETAS